MGPDQTTEQESQQASMIRLRHRQPTLWAAYLGEEVSDLWEPWMKAVDTVLEDEELLESV